MLGLVGLGLPLLLRLGLVGLALWLVSGIALNKYRCEYGTVNSMFAEVKTTSVLSLCHMHYTSSRSNCIWGCDLVIGPPAESLVHTE